MDFELTGGQRDLVEQTRVRDLVVKGTQHRAVTGCVVRQRAMTPGNGTIALMTLRVGE